MNIKSADYVQDSILDHLRGEQRVLLRTGRGVGSTVTLAKAILRQLQYDPGSKITIMTWNVDELESELAVWANKYGVDIENSDVLFGGYKQSINRMLFIDDAQFFPKRTLKKISKRATWFATGKPTTKNLRLLEKKSITIVLSSEYMPTVDKDWIEDMRIKYCATGVAGPVYRVHVQGEYPIVYGEI